MEMFDLLRNWNTRAKRVRIKLEIHKAYEASPKRKPPKQANAQHKMEPSQQGPACGLGHLNLGRPNRQRKPKTGVVWPNKDPLKYNGNPHNSNSYHTNTNPCLTYLCIMWQALHLDSFWSTLLLNSSLRSWRSGRFTQAQSVASTKINKLFVGHRLFWFLQEEQVKTTSSAWKLKIRVLELLIECFVSPYWNIWVS